MKIKKIWQWILLVTVILVLAAASLVLFVQWRQLRSQVKTNLNTYSEEYLYLNSITYQTFLDKLHAGEDFLVSIGRPSCKDCQEFDLEFLRIVEELDMQEDIYYFNIVEILISFQRFAIFIHKKKY